MHVSRLRGALAGDAGILLSGPHGYRLALAPEQFDAARFERLSDEGRRALAESDAPVAHRCLAAALALWRGPPLEGLGVLEPEVARLEEARLGRSSSGLTPTCCSAATSSSSASSSNSSESSAGASASTRS